MSAIPAAPRRILVVVTRRIGDVLLATPLIRSLKQAWPQSRIACATAGAGTATTARSHGLSSDMTSG